MKDRIKKAFGQLATKGAEGKIYVVHTVWPFNFFPDEVRLEEDKLTVIQRSFLFRKVTPIQIPDLLNIEVTEVPFFATIKIYAKYMTMADDWLEIRCLKKKDANKMRRLVNDLKASKEQDPINTGGQ